MLKNILGNFVDKVAETKKMLSKALIRYATEQVCSPNDIQLGLMTFFNDTCTPSYQLYKNLKSVRSITLLEIMGGTDIFKVEKSASDQLATGIQRTANKYGALPSSMVLLVMHNEQDPTTPLLFLKINGENIGYLSFEQDIFGKQ